MNFLKKYATYLTDSVETENLNRPITIEELEKII